MNKNSIYSRLRENFKGIIDYWGEDTRNDDILDFSQNTLPNLLEDEDSFPLYRYMPPKYYAIRGFENQTIYLSPSGKLNDVYEGVPNCVITENTVEDMQQLNDLAVMSCFCETPTSPLMWSHYADSQKGICVEYDITKLRNDEFNLLNHLFPVIYSDKRIFRQDFETLIRCHKQLRKDIDEGNVYDDETDFEDILPIFVTKGSDWSYEKEWRIVFTKKQLYDEDNPTLYSGIIPFKCVSGVYLGIRIDQEFKRNIIEICKRFYDSGNIIPVYQMELTQDTYELSYQQIFPVEK